MGEPSFRARQVYEWLWQKTAHSFDEMTNLSKSLREKLKQHFVINGISVANRQVSSDRTIKSGFRLHDGHIVEGVLIPTEDRMTACVSSQVGCSLTCKFCATGRLERIRNLDAAEIYDQVAMIRQQAEEAYQIPLSNIVYMGMGEPLDNLQPVLDSLEILTASWGYAWSPKRITVSTIGVIPAMQTFLKQSNAHLAVSMHTPFDDERKRIMPIQSVYGISEVVSELRKWDFSHQRRVSFEYIMFKGVNDTPRHAREIVRLLEGIRCRINLIRFHPIPDTALEGTPYNDMVEFQNMLKARGMTVTIRASRGEDIYAACGMLSTKELVKRQQEPDF